MSLHISDSSTFQKSTVTLGRPLHNGTPAVSIIMIWFILACLIFIGTDGKRLPLERSGKQCNKYISKMTAFLLNNSCYYVITNIPPHSDNGEGLGRPLDAVDFEYAAHLNQSQVGGDESTLTYTFEHEAKYDLVEDESSRSATTNEKRKWPKTGEYVDIPYVISSTFNDIERAIIALGIEEYRQKTCIR